MISEVMEGANEVLAEEEILDTLQDITSDVAKIEQKMSIVKERLSTLREGSEARINQMKELEKKVAQMNLSNKKAKINIGGSSFTTTITTLTKEPSMLSAMFGGSFSMEPDENGEYFIDRDPKFFSIILNYLRRGSVIITDLKPGEIQELKEEIQFYCLDGMMKLLEQHLHEKDEDQNKKDAVITYLPNQTILNANGIFYHLGMRESSSTYTNPVELGIVEVVSPDSYSFPDSSLKGALLFDLAMKTRSDAAFATSTTGKSIIIKVHGYLIKPTGYAIVACYSSHMPLNWTFSGCKEVIYTEGKEWVLLSTHNNEPPNNSKNGVIYPINTNEYFAQFKIENLPSTTYCAINNQFVFNHIEIFGTMRKIT